MSAPPVVVFKRLPLGMVEIAKLVEVAAPVVAVPEMLTLPAKSEVAVVEVALYAAAVGVEVETILVPSNAVSM